jgi:hypothetical protein
MRFIARLDASNLNRGNLARPNDSISAMAPARVGFSAMRWFSNCIGLRD